MKTHISKFLLICLFTIGISYSNSAVPIEISIAKSTFLQYEPVYLIMSADPGWLSSGKMFGPLENSANDFFLQITGPDGNAYQYLPAIRTEPVFGKTPDQISLSTIILHRHAVVTTQIGTYTFKLMDNNKNQLSNAITFEVIKPATRDEISAARLIESDPCAYGAFLYLQGGDFNSKGLVIVSSLADGSTGYSPFSNAIMAMFHAQISYDYQTNKIRRDKDISKSMAYFMKSGFNNADGSLKLKTIHLLSLRFPSISWPIEAIEKARAILEFQDNAPLSKSYFYQSAKISR